MKNVFLRFYGLDGINSLLSLVYSYIKFVNVCPTVRRINSFGFKHTKKKRIVNENVAFSLNDSATLFYASQFTVKYMHFCFALTKSYSSSRSPFWTTLLPPLLTRMRCENDVAPSCIYFDN